MAPSQHRVHNCLGRNNVEAPYQGSNHFRPLKSAPPSPARASLTGWSWTVDGSGRQPEGQRSHQTQIANMPLIASRPSLIIAVRPTCHFWHHGSPHLRSAPSTGGTVDTRRQFRRLNGDRVLAISMGLNMGNAREKKLEACRTWTK
ncbi:hypothetical protein GQ607_017379 [Colletotrichum asianum]|uniref:Uncharacterized protein n=1 Tax=Colletotrichum asianum TaxID=702518 RepID=A0A8H3VZ38_9PEZI|nr:hypothetical protein GQ607_017379 [Colletotrichum asianum]